MSEEKREQVVGLGRLGWSLRRIERETGVRRETAAGYLKAAEVPVRTPGRWGKGEQQAKPAKEVTTDPEVSGNRPESRTASRCEAYRELIEAGLSRGRNAMGIYQNLVDQHGFAGAYQSVKRFVRKLRGDQSPEPRAVIVTPPGEEAQVDYGTGPRVYDAEAGRWRKTRLFVMTLGYSRKSVRLLTFESSSQKWCELHEEAFRRLGGTPKVIVLDNLREGVLKPDIYDPALNPLYRDMLTHYGVIALPCRVGDPDRKGKVEQAVNHAQKTAYQGTASPSLEQAQADSDHWETNWADTRIHGSTKRQVGEMFAEEKPSLQLLPLEPFRYYQHGERTVNLDGCVEVAAAYYSTPPGWIGKKVRVQWDGRHVRVLDPRTGQLLREHLRQERGRHRIDQRDQSPRTAPGVTRLLGRAATLGPHCGEVCRTMYERDGIAAVRRILGVLALHRRHGVARLEDAARLALELNQCSYPFLRNYLQRSQPALTLQQVDPLIRQLTLYRDFIENTTKETKDPHEHHGTENLFETTAPGRHGRGAGDTDPASAVLADAAD